MKIRQGFVSNSSSSSFVCDVCRHVESGMDMSARDADMEECVNGHLFCTSHKTKNIGQPSVEKMRATLLEYEKEKDTHKWWTQEQKDAEILAIEKEADEKIAGRYEDFHADNGVSEEVCPICSFNMLTKDMKYLFLLKRVGMTPSELEKHIKDNFKSYKEFEEFLK